MQFGHVAKREMLEIVQGEQPVLDQFMGFGEHTRHVGHVEVADVGAEHRLELRVVVIEAAVESHRGHAVVGLAAEVEIRHESPPKAGGRAWRYQVLRGGVLTSMVTHSSSASLECGTPRG